MKAGSFLAFHAVRAILQPESADQAADRAAAHPGRGGRQPHELARMIEREASDSRLRADPRTGRRGGACVTARKGVGRFVMRVEGRGAHSGGRFQDGASAVVELARQIVRIHGMVDLDAGSR